MQTQDQTNIQQHQPLPSINKFQEDQYANDQEELEFDNNGDQGEMDDQVEPIFEMENENDQDLPEVPAKNRGRQQKDPSKSPPRKNQRTESNPKKEKKSKKSKRKNK